MEYWENFDKKYGEKLFMPFFLEIVSLRKESLAPCGAFACGAPICWNIF